MRQLIVALPAVPAGAGVELDHVRVADGQPPQPGRSTLALLPAVAGAELVALVPPDALSWHAVQLPRGVTLRSPRLRAVLEGLLEERLLDDPADLHLVAFARRDGGTWVAACDRRWLQGWCAALEAAQRPPDRLLAEAVPADEGTALLQVGGAADQPLACLSDRDGVWCGPLSALAGAYRPSAASGSSRPPDLQVRSEPQTAAAAERALATLLADATASPRVEVQTAAVRRMAAAAQGWDLGQGEFDTSGRARALRGVGQRTMQALRAPHWRPARWGVLALLLVQLVGLNAWAWHEQRTLAARRAAVQDLLRTTFPQVRLVVDAPLQMEREVAALRRASGALTPADLETQLVALSQALPAGRTASQIDYGSTGLRLRGITLDAVELVAARDRAQAAGYTLDAQGDTLTLAPVARSGGAR